MVAELGSPVTGLLSDVVFHETSAKRSCAFDKRMRSSDSHTSVAWSCAALTGSQLERDPSVCVYVGLLALLRGRERAELNGAVGMLNRQA